MSHVLGVGVGGHAWGSGYGCGCGCRCVGVGMGGGEVVSVVWVGVWMGVSPCMQSLARQHAQLVVCKLQGLKLSDRTAMT